MVTTINGTSEMVTWYREAEGYVPVLQAGYKSLPFSLLLRKR